MDDILEEILNSSSIDFPQKDLDLNVWDKKDNLYTIVPEVKQKILDVIGKYPDVDLIDMDEDIPWVVHIVGSICSNQYVDDADIDIHIVIPENSIFYGDIDLQKKVIRWFNDNRESIDGFIDKHPIEVFLQYDKKQDMMSVGVYDLLADEWLVGPKIAPEGMDPYEDYSHVADEIRASVEDADKLFGELKRDVIDFKVIEQAIKNMSVEQKELFLEKLGRKLEEIEDGIEALYKEKGDWVATRKSSSRPTSPEEALKVAKTWEDSNAVFKFINRYQYMKVIGQLKELLKDNELTPKEVDKISGIMGV